MIRPWGRHVVGRRGRGGGGIGKAVRPGALDWFWQETDTALSAADAARWAQALETLRARRARGEAIYSERGLARIAGSLADPIGSAARRHDLSEALILAVVAVESAGRARARSPKGAEGLMQLIPATAARFGVKDAFDPAQNLAGGSAYLDFLLDSFGGDVILALAGYNAGENAVRRHGGVPPYRETRDYVVRVLDALVAAERLCAAPPDSPRRACPLEPDPGPVAQD